MHKTTTAPLMRRRPSPFGACSWHHHLQELLVTAIMLIISTQALISPRLAMGYEKRNIVSSEFFDTVGYIEPNLETTKPSLPKYGTGSDDVIEADGWKWNDSRELWEYTARNARNNGASGASITIRYPQAGWMRRGTERVSDLLDIYVTFTAVYTNAENAGDHVLWGPYTKTGVLMSDGFWVENSMIYKTEYSFVDSATQQPVTIENGISYTERSLNVGEGFMIDGATVGYVANDMPDYVLGTNGLGLNWRKDEAEPVLRHTQVTELHLESNPACQGFVGTVPQTVRPDATATTNPDNPSQFDLFLNPSFDTPLSGGGNQYIQGVDFSRIVQATITANGQTQTFPDASMWMGASVIAPSADSIEVLGVNFPRNALGGRSLPISFDDFSLASLVFSHADSFEKAYMAKFGKHSRLNSHYKEPFGELKTDRWYVPQFHVFTAVTPPAPTKKVDKEETSLGEQINYTVTQPVNASAKDAWPGFRYASLTFSDTLPYGLSYREGTFKVYDTNDKEVTSGHLEVTGNAKDRYTLTWTADEQWLASDLPMNGGNLTFRFSTTADVAPDDLRYVNAATTTINDASLETNEVVTIIRQTKGGVAIKKTSSNTSITNDNPCYSLANAQYGVFADKGCKDETKVGTLTTDGEGNTKVLELDEGSYWVKELSAPQGFVLDTTIYEAKVAKGKTTIVEAKDKPQVGSVDVIVQKVDADTNKAVPQGSATLADAQFEVLYYAGLFDSSSLPQEPRRTWAIATNEDGTARLSKDGFVSGNDLYLDENGKVVIPLGTLVIRESKAPKGYRLPADQTICTATINPSDQTVETIPFGLHKVAEKVGLGGVIVKKVDKSTGAALKGASFAITNKSKGSVVVNGKEYKPGEVCLTCTSGADGLAKSENVLPYGSYQIVESKAPAGYSPNAAWKKDFEIVEDDQVVDLSNEPVQNEPLIAAARLTGKKTLDDAGTGRKLKDGEFTFALLDSTGKQLQAKQSDAQGNIAFDTMTFGESDAGKTFAYTVKEIPGSDQEITYDMHEEHVTIAVAKTKDGLLTATVNTDADGITFNNAVARSIGLPLTGGAGVSGSVATLLTLSCAAIAALRRSFRYGA